MAARRFPSKTVEAIRDAKIVGIRAGRGHHRVIGVWVVVLRGRVFIRSWRVSPHGWYHAFVREHIGILTVNRRTLSVSAIISRSDVIKREVSEVYAQKYNTPGSLKYVRDFARRPSRDATVELIPRKPKRATP